MVGSVSRHPSKASEEEAASHGPLLGLPAASEQLGFSLGCPQTHLGFHFSRSWLLLDKGAWVIPEQWRNLGFVPPVLSLKPLLRSGSSVKPARILLSGQQLLLDSASSRLPCSSADSHACLVTKRLSVNARGVKEGGCGCSVGDAPPWRGGRSASACPREAQGICLLPSCRPGHRGSPHLP